MAHVPKLLQPHRRKVCELYKKMRRNIEDYYMDRLDGRYEMVKLRKQFDDNKNIKDMRKAYALYLEAERVYEDRKHPMPYKFPTAVGGIAYDRSTEFPDSVLDYWHPIEKAFYPKYFAEREQLKKEYIEFYYKQYPDMKKWDEEEAKKP